MSTTTKAANLLVLNPYSQGFFVFTKTAAGNLEQQSDTRSPREILHLAGKIPRPRLAVSIGRAYDRLLSQLLFQETDLCLIPMAWLSHIPLWQVEERVQFAVQLTQAHLNDPIRIFGAKELIP